MPHSRSCELNRLVHLSSDKFTGINNLKLRNISHTYFRAATKDTDDCGVYYGRDLVECRAVQITVVLTVLHKPIGIHTPQYR